VDGQMDLLLLPASYEPHLITSYQSLVEFCNGLIESISVSGDHDDVLLGFDAEWDSLTSEDKQRQKPEILQLATADGKHIAVIKLSKVFPGITKESSEATVTRHNILRTLFDHPRVRASGVGVKGDVNRLLKHYPDGLVGSNLHRRVFDARVIGQRHYVVERGRHKARLQDLTKRLLGRQLNKVRVPKFPFCEFTKYCRWCHQLNLLLA